MMMRYLLTGLFLLALAPGSSFVLYVNDLDGAPVAGVTFTIQDADGQRHTATTDAKGQARIDGLPGSSVRIVQATYQGQKLTMDSNGPDRSGLTIPLVVGGEQRLAMDMAEGFIGVALQQPPPAQPFPTNTPEPTRTPRPRPTATPTNTPTPEATEATETPTALPPEAPTKDVLTTPASSSTPAQSAAAQPTNTPGSSSGVRPAPVVVAAPADAPAAVEEPAPTQNRTSQLLLGLGVLAVVVTVAYGLWWSRRRPL